MRAFALPSLLTVAFMVACSSNDTPRGTTANKGIQNAVLDAGTGGEEDGGGSVDDGPGAPPGDCGDLQKDDDGFFRRDSGKSEYVAYVPDSYDGSPTPLVIGLHGCGDDAANFATWGVAPYDGRKAQKHLAIALDGASGGGDCWDASDLPKIAAAVADLAKCVYVHRKRVVVAGYSSGGILAYREGLEHAGSYAGILISNSVLGDATLLTKASRKIPIAHRAHTEDDVFPIDDVRASWTKIEAAGFSLTKDEVSGGHDGTSDDWLWLLERAAGFD